MVYGLLEARKRYLELENGGGSVRPCDSMDLCAWVVDFESDCGRSPTWADLPEDMRSLTEKFSRWICTAEDGSLMPLVVKEARRLMDLS